MIDEKVLVERLEEESDFFGGEPMGSLQKHFYCEGVKKAISIVNQLAEESKNKYVRTDEVGYMLDTIEMCGDETWMDYYHKALKGLCELSGKESNNGWIPCSERLPKKDEYVLCSLNENNPTIIHTVIIARYDGADYWHNGIVLAWQPLPQPFKPKE